MPVRVRVGEFVLPRGALLEYARSASGPVARDMMRRGTNVQTEARRRVRNRTGYLGRSIVKRLTVESSGPVVYVSTSARHARWVHDGTAPHIIRPVRKKVLRFPAGGRVVFARIVRHPGSRANPFLRDALPAARF